MHSLTKHADLIIIANLPITLNNNSIFTLYFERKILLFVYFLEEKTKINYEKFKRLITFVNKINYTVVDFFFCGKLFNQNLLQETNECFFFLKTF